MSMLSAFELHCFTFDMPIAAAPNMAERKVPVRFLPAPGFCIMMWQNKLCCWVCFQLVVITTCVGCFTPAAPEFGSEVYVKSSLTLPPLWAPDPALAAASAVHCSTGMSIAHEDHVGIKRRQCKRLGLMCCRHPYVRRPPAMWAALLTVERLCLQCTRRLCPTDDSHVDAPRRSCNPQNCK